MMVKQDVPDFSPPWQRTNYQPSTNQAPSEPRSEAEAPLDHRNLEGLHTRVRVGATLTALSFPQSGTATRGGPTGLFSRKQKARQTPSFSTLQGTSQVAYSGPPQRDHQGNLLCLATEDQTETKKGMGITAMSRQILADPFLLEAIAKQKSQPLPLPTCRAMPVTLSARELSGQFCLVQLTGQQPVRALKPVLWHCPEGKSSLKLHLLLIRASSPVQSGSLNRETLQSWSSSYDREPSQLS